MSWYIQTEGSKYTNIVFSTWILNYKQIFKKNITVFLLSTILNHSQSALLHVTDDSRMKDVFQLTTAIVVASSTKKKKIKNN